MKLNKKNIILSMASLSLVAAVFFFNPQKAQAKDVTFRVTVRPMIPKRSISFLMKPPIFQMVIH